MAETAPPPLNVCCML